MALKCIIQLKYVTEAFSLYYSDIARCLPPILRSLTLVSEPCLGAGYVVNSSYTSTLFRCRVCGSILLILNMRRVSHAICMHVEVRVLHSCAFIAQCSLNLTTNYDIIIDDVIPHTSPYKIQTSYKCNRMFYSPILTLQ